VLVPIFGRVDVFGKKELRFGSKYLGLTT
jgi:hypothetical protein